MVKVGVVGLGAWGWNVARNFADLKDCQLVTCCDADPKRTGGGKKGVAVREYCQTASTRCCRTRSMR